MACENGWLIKKSNQVCGNLVCHERITTSKYQPSALYGRIPEQPCLVAPGEIYFCYERAAFGALKLRKQTTSVVRCIWRRDTKFQWMLGVVVSMLPAIGGAQEAYPSRPIRMVVAFTAGSSTDLMARIVANQMSVNLKQPVIVENRPGAGGAIAAGYVAKAPADGYTVLAHSGSYVIAPWLYKNLPYDPQRDP